MFEVSTIDSRQLLADPAETLALIELLTDRHAADPVPPIVEVTWHDGLVAYPVLSIARSGDHGVAWIDRAHRAGDHAHHGAPSHATFTGTNGRLIWQDARDLTLNRQQLSDLSEQFLTGDPETGFVRPDNIDWDTSPLHHNHTRPTWLPAAGNPEVTAYLLRNFAARARGMATALSKLGGPDPKQGAARLRVLAALLDDEAADGDRAARWRDMRVTMLSLFAAPIAGGIWLMASGAIAWFPGGLLLLALSSALLCLCLLLAAPVTTPDLVPRFPDHDGRLPIPAVRDEAQVFADELTSLLTGLTDLHDHLTPANTDGEGSGFLICLDEHTRALSPIPARLTTRAALL